MYCSQYTPCVPNLISVPIVRRVPPGYCQHCVRSRDTAPSGTVPTHWRVFLDLVTDIPRLHSYHSRFSEFRERDIYGPARERKKVESERMSQSEIVCEKSEKEIVEEGDG